jgi:hypothetical protein
METSTNDLSLWWLLKGNSALLLDTTMTTGEKFFIEKSRESHAILIGRIFVVEMIFLWIRRWFLLLKNFLWFTVPDLWMYWIIHIINVIVLIIIILYWMNKEAVLTEKQIIISQWLFHFESDTYNIENIEFIKVQNPILGRIFWYTNIYMYAPTIKENIYIKHIPKGHAHTFSNYIQQYISESKKLKIINAQNN